MNMATGAVNGKYEDTPSTIIFLKPDEVLFC